MSQDDLRSTDLGLTSLDSLDLTGAVTRMRRAISAASIGAGSQQELDRASRELVTELRNASEPPEQVLLAIKRILAHAGLRPGHPPSDPAMVIERHSELYRNVIASSIRHYFSSSDGDGSSPQGETS